MLPSGLAEAADDDPDGCCRWRWPAFSSSTMPRATLDITMPEKEGLTALSEIMSLDPNAA